jgi:CheY-like chemotaxis protein
MASILVVGDDPILLEARVDLLRGWHVSRATSRDATQSIRSIEPDLVIFCQTISDDTAERLADRAREINPSVIALVIFHGGQRRNVKTEFYEVQSDDPGRLRSFVAGLLQYA